jgi:hypothetical protein
VLVVARRLRQPTGKHPAGRLGDKPRILCTGLQETLSRASCSSAHTLSGRRTERGFEGSVAAVSSGGLAAAVPPEPKQLSLEAEVTASWRRQEPVRNCDGQSAQESDAVFRTEAGASMACTAARPRSAQPSTPAPSLRSPRRSAPANQGSLKPDSVCVDKLRRWVAGSACDVTAARPKLTALRRAEPPWSIDCSSRDLDRAESVRKLVRSDRE